jgi:hypothetical protein
MLILRERACKPKVVLAIEHRDAVLPWHAVHKFNVPVI